MTHWERIEKIDYYIHLLGVAIVFFIVGVLIRSCFKEEILMIPIAVKIKDTGEKGYIIDSYMDSFLDENYCYFIIITEKDELKDMIYCEFDILPGAYSKIYRKLNPLQPLPIQK